ncbi:MAG: acetyl-CoA acetyltransferase [Myxococcales bacterium]|nr:acetyl-CoA acetyltransferase [Myxococcales bacterium]
MGGARAPVLAGAAAVLQRESDPSRALEPVDLMARALSLAARDAGAGDWLDRADAILVPRGFWNYPDPGRLVAERIGARRARSILTDVGILQTTLFAHAAELIASGRAEVVLVTGGEAKFRSRCAERSGHVATLSAQPGAEPDEVLRPAADIMHPLELERGIAMPVLQYAMLESALRGLQGLGVEEQRRDVAEMWAAWSQVAAENPHAWRREAVAAEEIADAGDANRMIAFPYTKLHTSQWNVDQAAGLVFCSRKAAAEAGLEESRLVHLRAVAESNQMLPLVARERPGDSPASRIAGRRALALAGLELEEIRHFELYSCFPSAVRIQAREFGLSLAPPRTLTGGMAFAGGPLNNFVLQAAVRMVETLRADPGSHGFLTAVSGVLTKVGVSLWSTRPGEYRYEDVSEAVARETRTREVVASGQGEGRVVACTVEYDRTGPSRGVALCDLPEGRRTIVETRDDALMEALTREEFCGRPVRVHDDGRFEAI